MSIVRYDKTFTHRFKAFVRFTESIVGMAPRTRASGATLTYLWLPHIFPRQCLWQVE